MSLVVNTNVGSLNAQRSLAASGAELKTAMERLSSGSKINSASDDAAGFAIAERMTAQIRGLNMAAKNAGDGLSMLSAIENATNDVTDMLQRMRELAVQAVNDTNTQQDREYLQGEVTALVAEIDRVATQTQYNGQAILDGSMSGQIQVGTEAGQTVDYQIDGIGKHDLGNITSTSTLEGSIQGFSYDPNTGESSIKMSGLTSIHAGDTLEIGGTTHNVLEVDRVESYQGEASWGYQYIPRDGSQWYITDFSEDGMASLSVGDEVNITLSKNDGSAIQFSSFIAAKESFEDPILNKNGQAVFLEHTSELHNAFNQTYHGEWGPNGGNTSLNISTVSKSVDVITVEGNLSGVQHGAPVASIGSNISSIADLDLVNSAGAALATITGAIEQVAGDRAEYGALQNRLEYTVSNLMNVSEFTTAARSRIADADFAAESARLAKAQVLQQSGTAMLAQANASSQLALSLIR